MPKEPENVSIRAFHPRCLLATEDNTPSQPRFPVIDAHNHLFGELPPDRLAQMMDAVGVNSWINVSANAVLPLENNTYTVARTDFQEYASSYIQAYPGRFYGMTMADFAQWSDFQLFKPGEDFAEKCIATLDSDLKKGALGLKITKELGLKFTDENGAIIPVDSPSLFPIWQHAGERDVPVLMHISDPLGFFLPPDRDNEHLPVLMEFPAWGFSDSFYSKEELLAQRDHVIRQHPDTRFILPHVANYPENLKAVAKLLDECPNVVIDISARLDELGRQPYTARDFLIEYQDRVMFGIDMPPTEDIYRVHFRFLETRDEYFELPDYIGRWGKSRWRVCGLNLPDNVLQKIYADNARRVYGI